MVYYLEGHSTPKVQNMRKYHCEFFNDENFGRINITVANLGFLRGAPTSEGR